MDSEFFINSVKILSCPAALLFFSCVIAFNISWFLNGSFSLGFASESGLSSMCSIFTGAPDVKFSKCSLKISREMFGILFGPPFPCINFQFLRGFRTVIYLCS